MFMFMAAIRGIGTRAKITVRGYWNQDDEVVSMAPFGRPLLTAEAIAEGLWSDSAARAFGSKSCSSIFELLAASLRLEPLSMLTTTVLGSLMAFSACFRLNSDCS